MTVADKILDFYSKLEPPEGLPEDVVIMNPYQNDEAWQVTQQFYQKYYEDETERIVLIGINPGRFGGGITGIPFTDPIHLESAYQISNPFNKRAELSSKFIYEMIEAFGGPKPFYQKFFISAISPLGFVRNEKNLNYYDIENWKEIFEEYVVQKIKDQLDFPLSRKVAYSIGQGQNLKYLNALNQKHDFFEKIETVPHPRWVMQYRLKRKEEFINQYIETLNQA